MSSVFVSYCSMQCRCLVNIVPHRFEPSENWQSIPPWVDTAGLVEEAPDVPLNGTASCTAFDRLVKSRPCSSSASAAASARAPTEGIVAASHSRKQLRGRFAFEAGERARVRLSVACRAHLMGDDAYGRRTNVLGAASSRFVTTQSKSVPLSCPHGGERHTVPHGGTRLTRGWSQPRSG